MQYSFSFWSKLDTLFNYIFGGCPAQEEGNTTHEKTTIVKGSYTHILDLQFGEDGRLINMDIDTDLTEKMGTPKVNTRLARIEELELLKKEAVEKEDYRQAAEIVEEINSLRELEAVYQAGGQGGSNGELFR